MVKRIHAACSLPILAFVMPVIVVLFLGVMFLRRVAIDASHLVRLLIASAREFIADAEAVRLTQNPAALVSALHRIEGHSVIPGLAAGQDAMMIDGAHEGAFATHPTIAERVAAIIAVTGSMALIAPARRDTRPPELSTRQGFGRRVAPSLEAALCAQRGASAALARVSSGEFNRLGLTPELTMGAVAAIGVFLWAHSADLGRPSALVAAFDPAPLRNYFGLAREEHRCLVQGLSWTIGLAEHPTGCEPNEMLAAHRGKDDIFGKMADAMPDIGDGTFSSGAPPLLQLNEIREARCFQTKSYSVGDRGLHSVTEQPSGDISLPRYLTSSDAAAERVVAATSELRDNRLLDYFKVRKTTSWVIHRFFGDPGLQEAAVRYGYYAHQTAIAMLRERLTDPGFGSALNALERAELKVLAADPMDFISCTARRAQEKKKA